ncbi:hypothetical protein Tco_0916319 [Tanacetum coccineum]
MEGDDSSRNNHGHHQQPFKKQNAAKVYNMGMEYWQHKTLLYIRMANGELPKDGGNRNDRWGYAVGECREERNASGTRTPNVCHGSASARPVEIPNRLNARSAPPVARATYYWMHTGWGDILKNFSGGGIHVDPAKIESITRSGGLLRTSDGDPANCLGLAGLLSKVHRKVLAKIAKSMTKLTQKKGNQFDGVKRK